MSLLPLAFGPVRTVRGRNESQVEALPAQSPIFFLTLFRVYTHKFPTLFRFFLLFSPWLQYAVVVTVRTSSCDWLEMKHPQWEEKMHLWVESDQSQNSHSVCFCIFVDFRSISLKQEIICVCIRNTFLSHINIYMDCLFHLHFTVWEGKWGWALLLDWRKNFNECFPDPRQIRNLTALTMT